MRITGIVIVCSTLFLTCPLYAQNVEQFPGSLPLDGQSFSIQLERGQEFTVDLMSEDFDALLKITSPSREVTLENDDYNYSLNSRIQAVATESGTWTIAPSSYGSEIGRFTLRLEKGTLSSRSDSETGLLNQDSFKYGTYDYHDIPLSAGESIHMRIEAGEEQGRSAASLVGYMHSPYGEVYEFNEFSSGLSFPKNIDVDGLWRLYIVNGNETTEPVSYTLDYFVYEPPKDGPDHEEMTGRLNSESGRLPSGEYFNTHEMTVGKFEGTFNIELASREFDTYLIVLTAGERRFRNDDSDNLILSAFSDSRSSDSKLAISSGQLDESDLGTWKVIVTSYSSNMTGEYAIRHFIEGVAADVNP